MNANLSADRVLDGYRLVRFIGSGGFGEVWLCRSESMGDFRALKFIPTTHADRFDKEYEALLHYRKAASRLCSPHMVPIEHANRNDAGLYYVMPLADGVTAADPSDPAWQPLSLEAKVCGQSEKSAWFASREIIALILPVLEALQTLSDAGLVHRDVKPENILFFSGQPCLGDISLLGEDASIITRRGTPGYGTPSWYVGGQPDMYGAASTLYHLLTGNPPDKMGRSAFIWPPQGEASLAETERAEWKRLHGVIRRATDEKVSERYVDFATMAAALGGKPLPGGRLPGRNAIALALAVAGVLSMGAWVAAGKPGWQTKTIAPSIAIPSGSTTANIPDGKPKQNNAPSATPQPGKPALPELTPDEKADYQAHAGMIQGYMGDRDYGSALAAVENLLSTYPQARGKPAYSIIRAMALKGLGRIDEAKAELRRDLHVSPEITSMSTRKGLWEELGELAEAEKDLTRILDKFGPNTFPLFLRADIRAKRGDFPGVHADRQAAYVAHPDELEQRKLVDTMWTPLETKYPGYGEYVKILPPDPYAKVAARAGTEAGIEHDNTWILDVFDSIMSDIVDKDGAGSESALHARTLLAGMCGDGFRKALLCETT